MLSRWTSERAAQWSATQPWWCGFNYLPSTAINSTQMWDGATFDEPTIAREFGWARDIGFNACRVFLPFLVWDDDPDGFLARFGRFLELAARSGLSVMPILFDDCAFAGKEPHLGPQDAPIPGVHNSGWTPSPGPRVADDRAQWPRLEEYVRTLLERFGRDERIICWDVYNEPGNNERGNASLPLLEEVFAWARGANPMQPLTAGVWDWNLKDLSEVSLRESDVVSFHLYNSASKTREWIEELRRRPESAGRPLLCTEWMARTLESGFDPILSLWKEENVGNFFWGLVNGQTQTHFPWGNAQGSPEPELWFHDLLRRDGTPYDAQEVEFVRRVLQAV